jgi:hypothetical protein
MAVRRLLQAVAGAQARASAVKGERQESARRRRRASCGSGFDALEAERFTIALIDAGIATAERILFRDGVVEALWKEDHLVTLRALAL